MNRYALRFASWFTIGIFVFCVGTGWMVYQTTETPASHVRILMPIAMAAEADDSVIVGPNTTYKFAWTNPVANLDVVRYELGVWPEAGGDAVPLKVLEMAGPEVKYGAGSHSLMPLQALTEAIGEGSWKVRARALDEAGNASTWAPAAAIQIRVNLEAPLPLIEFRIIASISSGDCNGDGAIDIADMVWISNYLFGDGPEPKPCGWRV